MDQDVKTNRIILIVTFVLLLALGGFLLKFYIEQKKENSALKIKLISVSANKRTPTTWRELTKPQARASQAAPKKSDAQKASNPPTRDVQVQPPLAERGIESLAGELNTAMKTFRTQPVEELDKNIELADEIISREPSSFSAYKAKLISLLTKEGKYGQQIDDGEIDSLLETMASFDVISDSVARQEAALLSNANNQLLALEDGLSALSSDRAQVEQQLEQLPQGSPEWALLNEQYQELLGREEAAAVQLTQFENTVQTSLDEEGYLNEDVVEIPFMRLMAKNEFETVIENAQSFIEQFPTSVTGYYYLIRALEFDGRAEEVPSVIGSSQLTPASQAGLQNRLEQTKGINPKNFWETLNF